MLEAALRDPVLDLSLLNLADLPSIVGSDVDCGEDAGCCGFATL